MYHVSATSEIFAIQKLRNENTKLHIQIQNLSISSNRRKEKMMKVSSVRQ